MAFLQANKNKWPKCTIGSRKNSYAAYNIPAAFDIETNNCPPFAWHVCWQIGIAGTAFYGRTWDELREAINIIVNELGLDLNNRLIIYVHNLSFEWQWIRHLLPFEDGFSSKQREPYKVWTYNGLEFRDSLILSGLSLDATMRLKVPNSVVKKLTGSWDYNKQRHEQTPLTDDEIKYACYDVLCVMEYIQQLMEQSSGLISRIPLTRTGYVRQDCRKHTSKDRSYAKLMQTLTLTPMEYLQLRQTYMGGFTHASHDYVSYTEESGKECNKVLHNVGSYDFTSSYPACLVQFQYPMGVAIPHATPQDDDQFKGWLSKYCVMMDIGLYNVTDKIKYEHIISSSKCIEIDGQVTDNGRVVSADYLRIMVTEQDYASLQDFYDWEKMEIYDMTCYYKDYLPTSLVERILYYYTQKTTLKGVTGRETEYSLYKEMVNSIYGMMVQDPIQPVYYFIDGTFVPACDDSLDDSYDDTDGVYTTDVTTAIDKYNKKAGRYLYYPWGVWCTAYARRCLLRGIVACGHNYVYSDTDSIKYLLENSDNFRAYVAAYNDEVKQRMEAAMKHHGFTLDAWAPKDIKGIPHPLGYWDPEHDMDEFKSLGAKRYFYRTGDKYTVTLAGANKSKTGEYLAHQPDPFAAFCNGLIIPAGVSGRLVSSYIDEPTSGTAVDYTGVEAPWYEMSSVCLTESAYCMTMSDPFLMYLRGDSMLDIHG